MIYILLPIYNEEKSIDKIVASLEEHLSTYQYKIIAVNDGSNDSSLKTLQNLRHKNIFIESYIINMNIGAVFATGIARALFESKNNDDILIIMEADQTSSVNIIPRLIDEIDKNCKDIVIASRYQKGGKYINFPILRRIFSFFANKLMQLYFPIDGIYDYTIFFRAYRLSILKKAVRYFGLFGLIQSTGFVANAELLVKLSIFSDKIKEVPFIYNYAKKKGESKIRVIRTINEYITTIFYLKTIIQKNKNYQLRYI